MSTVSEILKQKESRNVVFTAIQKGVDRANTNSNQKVLHSLSIRFQICLITNLRSELYRIRICVIYMDYIVLLYIHAVHTYKHVCELLLGC